MFNPEVPDHAARKCLPDTERNELASRRFMHKRLCKAGLTHIAEHPQITSELLSNHTSTHIKSKGYRSQLVPVTMVGMHVGLVPRVEKMLEAFCSLVFSFLDILIVLRLLVPLRTSNVLRSCLSMAEP